MNRFSLLATSGLRSSLPLGVMLAFASPAFAQDAPSQETGTANAGAETTLAQNDAATEAETSSDSSIIVTGTRIRRPNLDSAVPISTVTAEELMGVRGDVSLGDALNQLPALRATFSLANSTQAIGTAGLNELDLRGLGTSRTLVLVNGRRHVSAVPGSYIVDVNTIPIDLLDRVDVVTGGNSAVYGSDAIAGVVNFILKKNYEGFKIRGQGGVSKYGDRGSFFVSGIAGHNFFDGRLNATLAVEYTRQQSLYYADRDYMGAINGDGHGGVPAFITTQITTAPNRNFDGIPNTTFVNGNPGATFGNISLGGYVITSCPAATATNAARVAAVCTGALNPTGGRIQYNYAFAPDGTLIRDDPSQGLVDNRAIGGGVLGGLSATGVEGSQLQPGIERYSANLMLNAELSPAFRPFFEGTYVHITAHQQSTQPTFIASTLSPTFSTSNPFLTQQARDTLALITGNAATFTMQRFNNDFGTRAEDHKRDTYRAVFGITGDISQTGNVHYEASINYGRTETYYHTGGNVLLSAYRNAINAVRNTSGQIVCGINADAITTNDDPACVPLNVFGFNAPSRAALDYVLFKSERWQWAEELDATAFISADSSGFFNLPGGPVGAALGVEYRREDANSHYDATTAAGLTFLNAFAPFAPPAVNIKEAFGEVRIPILADMPFFHELSIEAAARVSDYGGKTGAVWAYNIGGIWAPVRDLRFRATYARSVRAPNLTNLYATPAIGFQNALTDPCDQPGGTNQSNNINAGPNRAKNCQAAGIPTTITYTDSSGNLITRPWTNVPGSGVAGFNQGNPNLVPEVGHSFTLGTVFLPRFLPGFSASVDFYNIKITNVISGLTGQSIINRCYDDPGGIDNPFCAVVFRRTSADPLANFTFNGQTSRRLDNIPDVVLPTAGNGVGFLNQPFNFAALKTRGIDADIGYRHKLGGVVDMNLHAIVAYVIHRRSFSTISDPTRYDVIDGTLGDPKWQAGINAAFDFGMFDFAYNFRYIGKQIVSGLSYDTFFSVQGRAPLNPDARPFVYYKPAYYHNIRLNFEPDNRFRFYVGVDNVFNRLPPFELGGNENFTGGQTAAVYPNTGRFFYGGFEAKF